MNFAACVFDLTQDNPELAYRHRRASPSHFLRRLIRSPLSFAASPLLRHGFFGFSREIRIGFAGFLELQIIDYSVSIVFDSALQWFCFLTNFASKLFSLLIWDLILKLQTVFFFFLGFKVA